MQESGPGGDAAYLWTLAIDEALSRTDGSGTFAYLADTLGDTVALADAGGGLATTYTYAPFGNTTVSDTPSANPFQFTGRENDGTGLHYYRARYYDPARSRFVSVDPLGFGRGETNTYTYPQNNPVLYRDPTGKQFFGPGVPGPVLIKPIESPLLCAAAIGGMLAGGTVQIGAGVLTTAVGIASIPETGLAGIIVAGAGVVVTSGGVAMIGGALWAIPHLFPEIVDCPRPKSNRRLMDNLPLRNPAD